VAKFTTDKASYFWGETMKLDGSESYDSDGSIAKFEWRIITDNVTLPEASAWAEYKFSKKWNDFKIRLTVTDDKGARDVVEKTVSVTALYSALDVVATPKLITTLVYRRNGYVVSWKANPKNSQFSIVSHRIYRKVAGSDDGSYELRETLAADKLFFLDLHAEEGKSYVYAVTAVDGSGHQSPYVNTGI
jgi:hypothetical protein